MLNRTSFPLAPPWSGLSSWRRALVAGPTSQLLRFLLVLILLCGLTCLYLWQASTVSAIQQRTGRLNRQSAEYEQENVALMLQVARWNNPDYIAREATAQGMVPSTNLVYLRAPASTPALALADTP